MKPSRFLRPSPVETTGCRTIAPSDPVKACAQALVAGERLLLTCDYRKGAAISSTVERLLPAPSGADFESRAAHTTRLRDTQSRLIAPVKAHRIPLKNTHANGFLKELYPNTPTFHLPFPAPGALTIAAHSAAAVLHRSTLHPPL